MQALRKLLILSHRYIGIPLSFMFVLWFASAFVMIYTGGMPRITDEMRVEGASPLDLSQVALQPAEAGEIVGYQYGTVTLRNLLGRPLYEFDEPGWGRSYVFADNGEVLSGLDENQSRRLAEDFLDLPAGSLQLTGELNAVDQWTLTDSALLPFYKFSAGDDAGTEVYVAPDQAQVVVYTTERSRLMAWLGTIPHWLYFTSLRLNQPLWYDLVVWSAGIGTVMALLGLCLGVTQWRRKVQPFKLSRAIPYRGWLRWHYILGVVFGLFTLTWAFSGLLSMEPFAWTNARGLNLDADVFQTGEPDLAAWPAVNAAQWQGRVDGELKEIEFAWVQGRPWYLASYTPPSAAGETKRERLHQPYNIIGQGQSSKLLLEPFTLRKQDGFDPDLLTAQLEAAAGGAKVVEQALLTEYDDYYYSRSSQLPLPVLRVKFDDPAKSWLYVDPQQSRVLSGVHQWSRLERWLYSGLHSLDFAFWYHKRPLWDIGVIFLLAGGLLLSCLGLYLGLRRLRYDLRALLGKLRGLRSGGSLDLEEAQG